MMLSSTHFPGNPKVQEDRFDVYVNQDFIGEKKIYSSKENIYDLEDFLQEQGVMSFSTELNGHHFYIIESDLNSARQTKEVLQLYLLSP